MPQATTKLATDAFRALGPSDAIPNDFVVPYYLDDRKQRIAIARVNDRLYAFGDLCTCSGTPCPLSGGLLKDTTILCQCHGSRFDIATGAVINGPATKLAGLLAAPGGQLARVIGAYSRKEAA